MRSNLFLSGIEKMNKKNKDIAIIGLNIKG